MPVGRREAVGRALGEQPGGLLLPLAQDVHAEPPGPQHRLKQARAAVKCHSDHGRSQRQGRERAHRRAERTALGGGDDRDLSADGGHQVPEGVLTDHGCFSRIDYGANMHN